MVSLPAIQTSYWVEPGANALLPGEQLPSISLLSSPPPFPEADAISERDAMLFTPKLLPQRSSGAIQLTHQQMLQRMLLLLFSLRASVSLLTKQFEQTQHLEQQARERATTALQQAGQEAEQLPQQKNSAWGWLQRSAAVLSGLALTGGMVLWGSKLRGLRDNVSKIFSRRESWQIATSALGVLGIGRQLWRGFALWPQKQRTIRLQQALLQADYAKSYQEQCTTLLQHLEQHTQQAIGMTEREIQRLAQLVQQEIATIEQIVRR